MDDRDPTLDYRDPDWVAQRLGVDKATVYKFLQEGVIPAVQLGRKWLISEARLARWLEEEAEKQTSQRREAVGQTQRLLRQLDNFTAGARMALKQAHSEARSYNHHQLGQEHLLLGLLHDPASPAARAIRELGLDIPDVRKSIQERNPPGDAPVPRRLGRTPQAKRAMRLAAQLAHRSSPEALVGTDHLLVGLFLSRQGLGFDLLKHRNISRRALEAALERFKREEQP